MTPFTLINSIKTQKVLSLWCFYFLLLGNLIYASHLSANPERDGLSRIDTKHIPFDDEALQYEGRVQLKSNDAAYLYWAATKVRLKFKGKRIAAILEDDEKNHEKYRNYFYLIVDGKVTGERIKIESGKNKYTLAEGLEDKEHVIELYKLTSMHPGYPRGYSKFYGFLVDENAEVYPPPVLKERKIEFYGNSITNGFGIEDYEGGHGGQSLYENNYKTYAALVARHFNAQFHCIAKSGVGELKGTTLPNMPEMYDRIDPFGNDKTLWNFSYYTPDLVVINLLQNDAFQIPDESAEKLITKYREFLKTIRKRYPSAHIVGVLGSMSAVKDQKWLDIIRHSIEGLEDDRMSYHFFEYQGKKDILWKKTILK